jgi:uncharacterized protein YheU (UPF0270 family)
VDHGFEEHQAKAFFLAREGEDAAGIELALEFFVADVTKEINCVGLVVARGDFVKPAEIVTTSDDAKTGGRDFPADGGERFDQVVDAFVAVGVT